MAYALYILILFEDNKSLFCNSIQNLHCTYKLNFSGSAKFLALGKVYHTSPLRTVFNLKTLLKINKKLLNF
jgi:hypothetical protein